MSQGRHCRLPLEIANANMVETLIKQWLKEKTGFTYWALLVGQTGADAPKLKHGPLAILPSVACTPRYDQVKLASSENSQDLETNRFEFPHYLQAPQHTLSHLIQQVNSTCSRVYNFP